MTDDRSVLKRLEDEGRPAPRVDLGGAHGDGRAASRYQVLGELARGAAAEVLRGRDNDLGREVAIKVLARERVGDAQVVQRLVEEAQIAGQLQHPGILPVYELGLMADARPYFVMKLVEGETMAARLAGRRGVEDDRRELLGAFRETCLALAYAHARGVVHRDVQPANVLVGAFGEVQVVGWGRARVLPRGRVHDEGLAEQADRDPTRIPAGRTEREGSGPTAAAPPGNPAYLSPEQALGRMDELDEKSDLFGLGAVLAEILTGRPPYEGSPDEQRTAAARAELGPALVRLDACGADPRLVSLCKRCLSPLRPDRPASVKAVADELAEHLREREQLAHDARIRALEAEAAAEAQQRARRHTVLVSGTVVAVLGLVAGVWLWHADGVRRRDGERRAAIEAALQQTSELRAAGDWDGALAAADRAIQLGHRSELTDEIRRQAADALAAAAQQEEEDELLQELEGIRNRARPMPEGDASGALEAVQGDAIVLEAQDERATDAAYARAFDRRFGGLSPAVERLAASPHAREFAANLGFWCWIRKVELKAEGWEEIDRAARRIDPGHAAIRNALVNDDQEALLAVAQSGSDEMPLALAADVGMALAEQDETAPAALEFLRRQQLRDPSDFWINNALASAADRVGDSRLAARHFLAALTARPRDALTWCRLGQVLYARPESHPFDREGAVRAFERVVELAPDDPVLLAYAGGGLSNMGEHDRAVQVLRRAVELDPDFVPAVEHLGIALLARGDHEEAVALLERALQLDPEDAGTWGTLGAAYDRMGRVPEAEEATRRALALDPELAFLHSNLANILSKRGEVEAAVAETERALAMAPDDFRVLTSVAMALHRLEREEEALELANRAVALAPDRPGSHLARGLALNALARREEAVEAFRRGIELDPRMRELHGNLASTLGTLRRLDEALAEVDIELQISPNAAATHRVKGWILIQRGDPAGAIAPLRRSIELDPSAAESRDRLGEALTKTGDSRGAEEQYRWLLENAPDLPNVKLNLGVALLQQGRIPEAVALFAEVVGADPTNANATLDLAIGLESMGRGEKALPLYRRAAELAPGDPNIAVTLAEALRRAGLEGEAREARRRALELDIRDPAILVRLGGALSDAGELEDAVHTLRRALEIDPRARMARRFLGVTLRKLGDVEGAAAVLLEDVAIEPDDAWCQAQCGSILFELGRVEPAVKALERAVALQPDLPFAQRYLRLAGLVPGVLAGEDVDLPADDHRVLAVSLQAQGLFAESAGMYARAFDKNPRLASDIRTGALYNAACAAARAGGTWRLRAIAWLRDMLTTLEGAPPTAARLVVRLLDRWRSDPDLASIRDADDRPPESRELWTDVEELRAWFEQVAAETDPAEEAR